MKRKNDVWFTSDLHIGHKNIVKPSFGSRRPYETIEDFHEALIENWNKKVKPEDTIYVLGDITFCGYEKTKSVFDRLNGKKILIRGNHDQSYSKLYRIGFDFIVESMQLKMAGKVVNLSHFPYRISKFNEIKCKFLKRKLPRYHMSRLVDDGKWLLHGHTHSKEQIKNKMIHVGLDAWNFSPVNIETIEKIIQKGENNEGTANKK